MKIGLFYLATPKYGGWVTFTSHLYRSLHRIGCQVYLFKISKRTEPNQRPFCDGIKYQNIDIETAKGMAEQFPTIVTASDKNYAIETKTLLANGANVVIHDPTEMKGELLETVRENGIKPITIREVNVKNLAEAGVDSTYVKHPYLRFNDDPKPKTELAVATSRIDFDKHTDIIIEANKSLKREIKIFGAENRLYGFHKLDQIDRRWRRNYYGRFQGRFGEVFKILNPSKYMIDMSAIKKDGGGSQYTFLEGWDAGCVLILNRDWGIGDSDVMKENHNCLYAQNAAELIDLLNRDEKHDEIVEAGYAGLKEFEGESIARQYMKLVA